MKLSRCFYLIVGIPTFAGCATDPATFKLALEAQQNVKPTLSIKCPAGCEAEYTDPRDRQNVKLPTSGYDAYIATLNTVGGVVGAAIVPGAMAYTAVEGIKAMKGHGATTTTNTDNSNRAVTTNTDNSNRSTTTSTTDSSNRSTSSVATTTSTATTTTTTATDSYNPTTTTSSNNPVTTNTPTTTTTTTNPSTNPPVCAIDGTGALVCH